MWPSSRRASSSKPTPSSTRRNSVCDWVTYPVDRARTRESQVAAPMVHARAGKVGGDVGAFLQAKVRSTVVVSQQASAQAAMRVEARELSKRYPKSPVAAVDSISYSVGSGQ